MNLLKERHLKCIFNKTLRESWGCILLIAKRYFIPKSCPNSVVTYHNDAKQFQCVYDIEKLQNYFLESEWFLLSGKTNKRIQTKEITSVNASIGESFRMTTSAGLFSAT